MEKTLPTIPDKHYFTIGEVSELCGVKPYVLRYWEQEFSQLKPMKRRGNRRYYQHHEVLLVWRIRGLLYEQGFTISGARNQLAEWDDRELDDESLDSAFDEILPSMHASHQGVEVAVALATNKTVALATYRPTLAPEGEALTSIQVREELLSIRDLLTQ
jgi:DNA-binding transcriptional MerR regulator